MPSRRGGQRASGLALARFARRRYETITGEAMRVMELEISAIAGGVLESDRMFLGMRSHFFVKSYCPKLFNFAVLFVYEA